MEYPHKKTLYLTCLLIGVITGSILVICLYFANWSILITSYNENDGALGVILIIVFRIAILSGMTCYTFFRWFKQEEHYLSDIPFLFGLFFLLLVFGKALDLLGDLVFFYIEDSIILLILKIRFIILIISLLPMIYLSIGMILFSLSLKEKYNKLKDEQFHNKIRKTIIILILLIESVAGIFAPSITVLSFYYPIIAIPSLLTIFWLFYFAFKNKRLSQVDPSILTIGFGALLVSQILRPLAQFFIGESVSFLIVVEIIDLIIFLIIFIGFYKKANY